MTPGAGLVVAAALLSAAAAGIAARSADPVSLGDVEASGFARCGDDCFSGTGDGFHLLAAEITPSADDDYELHLAVRRLPGAKVELHGDFFAAGYEDDDQEDVVVLDMGSLERGARLRWNAGDAPESAHVRVFYTGPPGVELAGLRLVRTARVATRLARALAVLGAASLAAAIGIVALAAVRRLAVSPRRVEALALLALWLGLVLVRLLQFRATPVWAGDEYAYKSLAAGIHWLGGVAGLDPSRIAHLVSFPNLVYPLLIAPAFAFESGFHALLHAINAALVSAAVLPAYLLARRFFSAGWSLAFAAFAATIPFTTLGAFALTEVAFYPLFLLWAWVALRALEPGASSTTVASAGALIGVLCNVRLNAYVLLPALALALLVVARAEERRLGAALRRALVVLPCAFLATGVALHTALHRGPGFGLGIYGFMLGRDGRTPLGFTVGDHVDLVLGHLAGLAVPYALPMVLVATGLGSLLAGRWRGDGARFVTLAALAAASLVALAFAFTLRVAPYDLGGLGRWHARYYFVATPLVLLAGAVVASRPGFGGRRERSVVLAATALWLATGGVFVFGRAASQSPWFGSIVDGMDARWLRGGEPWYAVFALATLVVAGLVCARSRRASMAATAVLVAWLAVAHAAIFDETRLGKTDPATTCGLAAGLVLAQAPGRFAIATSASIEAFRVGFEIPYLPERVAWGDDVAREKDGEPWARVDYVVTYGGVAPPGGGRAVLDAGACRVYRTREGG